tara:strand:- start:7 stop:318 length:312 start_codon:yes stop_codon:yes gene_type:complete
MFLSLIYLLTIVACIACCIVFADRNPRGAMLAAIGFSLLLMMRLSHLLLLISPPGDDYATIVFSLYKYSALLLHTGGLGLLTSAVFAFRRDPQPTPVDGFVSH